MTHRRLSRILDARAGTEEIRLKKVKGADVSFTELGARKVMALGFVGALSGRPAIVLEGELQYNVHGWSRFV